MSRVHRSKKDVEVFFIREFVCNSLGYKISHLRRSERPDAIFTLRKGKTTKRVAIEITRYFNNTVPGKCSPLTPIADFWACVQTSLSRRISHRKHLADVMGIVGLYEKQFTNQLKPTARMELARRFAQELVDFLENHHISESHFMRYPSTSSGRRLSVFSNYPILKTMLASILMRRVLGLTLSRCNWTCNNISAGAIGLNLNYIRNSITEKNNRASTYDWQNADEKWLLMVAACGNVSEHAGPPEESSWSDSTLHSICSSSRFDHIYFSERARRWYKLLKPNWPIIVLQD